MKASLVAVLLAAPVAIIQFIEVTFVENISAHVAMVVGFDLWVCVVSLFRYAYASRCYLLSNLLFSFHDFYSGFEKDAKGQTHTHILIQVCVLRVMSFGPMESVITTGHCTLDRTDSQLPCMCVWVYMFF